MRIDNDDSNTLLMFSGGLDSTGALWQLLQNKENKVHIHHLHLFNKENRAKAEHIAVKNIISYISRYYKVKYSESYHQYPYYSYLSMADNSAMVLNQNFMFDSDLYNFIAGTICTSLPNIKTVAIGRTKSDLENTEIIGRTIIGTSIFKLLAPNVEKVYPVGHMTKSEVYNIIPEDLRSMTWSCRIPIYTSENMIQECGKCKTCLELHRVKYGI
jgi:7-cyano-7-deazaguanine synthase in queuosine biosynthesis